MPLPIEIVDAFHDRHFAGNPAAICFLDTDAPDKWRQQVAAEFNLSETAFVRPLDDGFELRWFTPATEVDLCGHATLAAAHAMWRRGLVPESESIRFHTRSGVLTCVKESEWIQLDFPAVPADPCSPPDGLFEALGIKTADEIRGSRYDLLVAVETEETVHKLTPNFSLLKNIPTRGIIVTARANQNSEFDFVSRFFAPQSGIDEDPVTGSAHCTLAPFWGEILGKPELTGKQISSREGIVKVSVRGDRVLLGGQARTTVTGELHAVPEQIAH